MRDGVELLTDVYTPEAMSLGTVLIRTYGRTGLIAPSRPATTRLTAITWSTRVAEGLSALVGTSNRSVKRLLTGPTLSLGCDVNRGSAVVSLCGASYVGHAAWALMMEPPPELVAAVIAVSAHDAHWVAHGAGAFSLEDILGLMDGLGHLEGGVVRGSCVA